MTQIYIMKFQNNLKFKGIVTSSVVEKRSNISTLVLDYARTDRTNLKTKPKIILNHNYQRHLRSKKTQKICSVKKID